MDCVPWNICQGNRVVVVLILFSLDSNFKQAVQVIALILHLYTHISTSIQIYIHSAIHV